MKIINTVTFQWKESTSARNLPRPFRFYIYIIHLFPAFHARPERVTQFTDFKPL